MRRRLGPRHVDRGILHKSALTLNARGFLSSLPGEGRVLILTSTLFDSLFSRDNIVHIAALFYLAGFLFRNQLLLRGLIIAGDLIYIAYFFFAPATPLWGAIFWSALFIAVNIWMIGLIVVEQRHFTLTGRERKLFDVLHDLTPGQFRQLLRLAGQGEAQAPMVITAEGQPLDRLYFVLSGRIDIEKTGRRAVMNGETFIGEIAFLLDRSATATVTLDQGCYYFVWTSEDLKKAMAAKPALGSALTAAMNRSLAMKVAKSDLMGMRAELEPMFAN